MPKSLKGWSPQEAIEAVKMFRSSQLSFGWFHDTDALIDYFNHTWPKVISQQPEPPESYRWKLGFLRASKQGTDFFFIVPLLVSEEGITMDPLEFPEHYKTDIFDEENAPIFFMDEGSKWP